MQATRLVDFLLYKGPIGLAALFLALGDKKSPPNHFLLRGKLEEIGTYVCM